MALTRIDRAARWRDRLLLASAAAWAILVPAQGSGFIDHAYETWPAWAQIPFFVVLLFVVLNAAVLGLVGAFWMHVESRCFRRLMRGDAIIGRWRVSPAAWERYKALCRELGVADGDLAQPVPPDGVECFASAEAAMLGTSFLHLRERGIVSRIAWVPPHWCIRFDAVETKGATVQYLARNACLIPFGDAHKTAHDMHVAWLWRFGLIGSAAGNASALRRLKWSLVALGVSLAMMAPPFVLHSFDDVMSGAAAGPEMLGLPFGFLIFAFAFGFTLRFAMDSLRQAGSTRGALLGSWRVSAADWRAFAEADARRRADPSVPWNVIDPRARKGAVRIAADGDALVVGSDVIDVPALAAKGVRSVDWIDGPVPMIELAGVYHARVGAFSRLSAPSGDWGDFTLRFPVPRGAEAEGRKVLDAWRARFLQLAPA